MKSNKLVLIAALAALVVGLGVGALVAALLAGGEEAERSTSATTVSESESVEAAGEAVRDYVERSGDAALQRNLDTAIMARRGQDYFRICITVDTDERSCLLVDTSADPPQVERDPNQDGRP